MKFFFITASPELARFAIGHGVDRIFVDLEILGKHERQGHLSTVISRHSFQDLREIRKAVSQGEVMARLNPINPATQSEIDEAVDAGADLLMLPMFHTRAEVAEFAERTRRRARISLLAETRAAVETIAECAAVEGVDEIHIGLNDLSLDLRLTFMFKALTLPLVEQAAKSLRESGKPFGIGGLARVGEGLLPAEMIVGEHVRLGSTAAILSRTFHRQADTIAEMEAEMDFGGELDKLRAAHRSFEAMAPTGLEDNRKEVVARIDRISRAIMSSRDRQPS